MSTAIQMPRPRSRINKKTSRQPTKRPVEVALNLVMDAYQNQSLLLQATQEQLLLARNEAQEARRQLDALLAHSSIIDWD